MPTFREGLAIIKEAGHDASLHRLSRLLLALYDGAGDPAGTVRGLAAYLDVQASCVTRGTDRLIAMGLATRATEEHDRRSVLIKLTEQGQALAVVLGS